MTNQRFTCDDTETLVAYLYDELDPEPAAAMFQAAHLPHILDSSGVHQLFRPTTQGALRASRGYYGT